MEFKRKSELMDLPNFIKFGLEIEVQNCDFKAVESILNLNPELKNWKVVIDTSLYDNGAEIVSPPLNEKENPNLYKELELVLNIVKSHPKDKSRRVYVNEQCGGHIHFDAEMMKSNPEMIECFLRLWKESEILIYKMCNAENDVIRENAVKGMPIDGLRRMLLSGVSEIIKAYDMSQIENSNFIKHVPSAIFSGGKKFIQGYITFGNGITFTREGFAHPIGKSLNKVNEHSNYIEKVIETKNGTKIKFNKNLRKLSSHTTGINLQHLTEEGVGGKFENFMKKRKEINTYEFRMHNSPPDLDVDTWKQNILFDAAFSKIAYEMAYEKDKNNEKLYSFFEKDITEEEKADRFLELLFDNEEDRRIYKARWEAVKDEPIYAKMKGLDNSCIKKDDLETISLKTLKTDVYRYMGKFCEKAKEFMRDESSTSINKENLVVDYGGRDDR